MATTQTSSQLLEKLRTALATKFPVTKVDEVLLHYEILRKEARLDHYETCLVNGGKFVEAVLKCLHYLYTGAKVDFLKKVDEEIRQLENASALSDSERMTIPRVLKAIYEFRNKRGGAHNSSFDPIRMDCAFVVTASSWVMEELTRLYLTNDPVAAQTLISNLLVKDLPLIEEIDGDYLVLKPELSARIQLELILYVHFPIRCSMDDLIRWIRNHTTQNVRTTLRNMKQKNLIHESEVGWKLTEAGMRQAEEEIAQIQGSVDGINEINKTPKKGTKNGKRRTRKVGTLSR